LIAASPSAKDDVPEKLSNIAPPDSCNILLTEVGPVRTRGASGYQQTEGGGNPLYRHLDRLRERETTTRDKSPARQLPSDSVRMSREMVAFRNQTTTDLKSAPSRRGADERLADGRQTGVLALRRGDGLQASRRRWAVKAKAASDPLARSRCL